MKSVLDTFFAKNDAMKAKRRAKAQKVAAVANVVATAMQPKLSNSTKPNNATTRVPIKPTFGETTMVYSYADAVTNKFLPKMMPHNDDATKNCAIGPNGGEKIKDLKVSAAAATNNTKLCNNETIKKPMNMPNKNVNVSEKDVAEEVYDSAAVANGVVTTIQEIPWKPSIFIEKPKLRGGLLTNGDIENFPTIEETLDPKERRKHKMVGKTEAGIVCVKRGTRFTPSQSKPGAARSNLFHLVQGKEGNLYMEKEKSKPGKKFNRDRFNKQ